MLRLVGSLLLASVVAACGWKHAPGHDARDGMTKTAVPAIKPQLCLQGACNLAGPEGTIHVSILEASTSNSRRETTAFELEYVGAKATCRGPAIGPDEAEVPFACSIEGPAASPSKHVLVMHPGCTDGALHRAEPGQTRALGVRTDVVTAAGFRSPGREVSLTDEQGVLAFSDHQTPYDLLLFTPTKETLRPSELLAIVALNTFRDLEGRPPQCLLPE